MITRRTLEYLAFRLANVNSDECMEAARLIERVLASGEPVAGEVEHALCRAVWRQVSRALDVERFASAQCEAVKALEAEMAGRVLSFRVAHGELVPAEAVPGGLRHIARFLGARGA